MATLKKVQAAPIHQNAHPN